MWTLKYPENPGCGYAADNVETLASGGAAMRVTPD